MGMFKRWREAREQRDAETLSFGEGAEKGAQAEGYRGFLHKKAAELAKRRWGA